MENLEPVKQPTRKEMFTLRTMIVSGLVCMGFFMYALFDQSVVGYAPLYWLLIITFAFTCLKIIHEWLHYFHITVPETPPHTKTYTVDIFTTFCAGEPYEMIVETLEAIQKITYPHEAYLCDEADDPYVKEVCKRLGVHHVTRTKKIDAKAGNINNALRQSSGELCVVLDPDHVPFPNFLDPIVSHFNNPEVGYVQVVQAYKNQGESLIAKGAAQQTYHFYGPMMMTMNKYGTVLAIGANCTFRRTALESIGGHAAGLAEDMHTAMQLHAAGWKSVYVPTVLARGLVPSTLSAYFKQQMKWSRGVFELLVTSYPKLFKKFTWQQKLHYGIIPMHYLSGVIFLLNFLIPIVSLLLNVSPIKINLMTFGLIGLPMVASIVIIRHYVQRWVMEDEERGFHLVGGLLMMGSWWVFILGFVYTLIRKPIPYIPTPKDSNEENNWPLNIPNLVVLGLSVVAIVVGSYIDPSPYTYFMAGLAGLNCVIMIFNIVASRQQQIRRHKESLKILTTSLQYTTEVKKRYWRIRDWMYTGGRSVALLLGLVIVPLIFYCFKSTLETQPDLAREIDKRDYFLSGIFSPVGPNGMTSMSEVKGLQEKYNTHFDIISFYIAWGNGKKNHLPIKVLDSVYNNGSVPMITWEPWQSLFAKSKQIKGDKEAKVFSNIAKGEYDEYLQQIADEVRSLKRPVFIRFAHEPDNTFYPWSAKGGNTPEDFKNAWRYVHDFFTNRGADNAIWVWNPWKPEAVTSYFPGRDYVDWIGITNLNYGTQASSRKWYSMQQLYFPYHSNPILTSGLPVMLAETGSLKSEGRQTQWFKNGFASLKRKFPEIKATVFFNSAFDQNLPLGKRGKNLDWRVLKPDSVFALAKSDFSEKPIENSILRPDADNRPITHVTSNNLFFGVRGVNYSKAKNLYDNSLPFAKSEILRDFEEMKKNGINTVKISSSAHINKILDAAEEKGIRVNYEFWIADQTNFVTDKEDLKEIAADILTKVNHLKKEPAIAAWNLGNPVLQKLSYFYYKPELIYHQLAYIGWLKKLIVDIKKIDPSRPVSVEVEVGDNLLSASNLLHRRIPEIDAFGLVLNEESTDIPNIAHLKRPYFFSKAEAGAYLGLPVTNVGAFIADWQDQQTTTLVTFDGLKDHMGRDKYGLRKLSERWTGHLTAAGLPNIKILRPATTVLPDVALTYHALVEHNNEWHLADEASSTIKFKWDLVKTDRFDNALYKKHLGIGNSMTLKVPDDPSSYKVCLTAIKGDVVTTTLSTLHTPLDVAKEDFER